jgi:uncharacterized membrane protein
VGTPGEHPAPDTAQLKRKRFTRTLRRHLIEGLVVITPLVVTGVVLRWVFLRVDGLLGQFLYPQIGVRLPGLGLVTLIVLLIVIGWAAERAIGARLLDVWQELLDRIPVASRIYGAASRFIRTVFREEARPFNEVVLVEYPSPQRWSIGLIAARAPEEVQEGDEERITIFIPNTPNVATGRLVVVPRSLVKRIDLTVEQAFTFALSAGTLKPGQDAEPPRESST